MAMADLESAAVSLAAFSGVAFAGGFSYADVMDSAKGWSGKIRMNASLLAEFNAFYQRKDTFSLGICNGCQLMVRTLPGSRAHSIHTCTLQFTHPVSVRRRCWAGCRSVRCPTRRTSRASSATRAVASSRAGSPSASRRAPPSCSREWRCAGTRTLAYIHTTDVHIHTAQTHSDRRTLPFFPCTAHARR